RPQAAREDLGLDRRREALLAPERARRAPDDRPPRAVRAAAGARDRHAAAARVARLPPALVRAGGLVRREHGHLRRGPVPALLADGVAAPGRAALDLRRRPAPP